MSELNERIKAARVRTGLSQSRFAAKFHIKLHSLQTWEQGAREPMECVVYMIERILDMEEGRI